MRVVPVRAFLATLFLLSACTISLPAGSPSAQPSTTTYATVEAALRVLVEHHVNKPSSQLLLQGAAADVDALLLRTGTPSGIVAPTFGGGVEDDLRAFAAYLDQVIAKVPSASKSELERAAVSGMAKSTGECHTYYLDPERAKTFNTPARERYSGIGARIQQSAPNSASYPEITQVFPGSPAQQAGLQMGDRIKTVDARDVAGLTAQEVADLIKGPEGTSVNLAVLHGTAERQVTITRATLVAPEIAEALVGDQRFGLLGVSNITASIPRDMRESMERLDRAGADGWILDLRSDPGGLLEPAEQVASTFIRAGNILYEVRRDGNALPKPVNPKNYYSPAKPLAVIVNRYSASGAEIIASAVQEHGVGRVFGEATAGCISIALPRELPDGGMLLYTYAKIQSGVTRTDLSGRGVTPDELVAAVPDRGGDEELEAAIAWLRTQARN